MKNRLYWIFIVVVLFCSGCATVHQSAFDASTEKLDFTEKSYFIMGFEIENAVKPKYNPNSNVILHVEEPNASDKSQRFNFVVRPEEFLRDQGGPAEGYVLGALAPGEYIVKGISGISRNFPFVGTYSVPLDEKFVLSSNEVIELGKLRARTRDRSEGEFRAGPVLPLLDQSTSGFSGSTFDVVIQGFDEDSISYLKQTYPALRSEIIVKRNLPPYDRSRFDGEDVVAQQDEPVFHDDEGEHLASALFSEDPAEMRVAAIDIGRKKLYANELVVEATISVLRMAVANPDRVTDRNYIDGLAWCALNLGNSGSADSIEVLTEVVESDLPQKVKKHAEDAM